MVPANTPRSAPVRPLPVRYIPPQRAPLAWLVAAGGAAGAGALVEPVSAVARILGLPPQLGTVLAVNVLLPGVVIAAVVLHPRFRWVPVTAALALLGFTCTRALQHDWRAWTWSPGFFLGIMHPIAVAACAAGGVIGGAAAAAMHPWRRVGVPSEPARCRRCGYLLTGLAGPACPECGVEITAGTTGRPAPSARSTL
jgi:hypothetical protein